MLVKWRAGTWVRWGEVSWRTRKSWRFWFYFSRAELCIEQWYFIILTRFQLQRFFSISPSYLLFQLFSSATFIGWGARCLQMDPNGICVKWKHEEEMLALSGYYIFAHLLSAFSKNIALCRHDSGPTDHANIWIYNDWFLLIFVYAIFEANSNSLFSAVFQA